MKTPNFSAILFATVFFAKALTAQNNTNPGLDNRQWLWGKTADCPGSQATCLASDKNGNVFTAGYFHCTETYFGSYPLSDCMYNDDDVFFVKYNSSGKSQSATWMHGWGSDRASAMAIDDNDNVFLTGNFDGPWLAYEQTQSNNSGSSNFFVVKYSATGGGTVWRRQASGNTNVRSQAIAADNNGNFYLAGYFWGASLQVPTTTLGMMTSMNTLVNSNSQSEDAFLAKYTANGDLLWITSFGKSGNERINAITCDASGNVLIGGSYESAVLKIGNDSLIKGNTGSDLFIAKYSASGTPQWVRGSGSATGSLKATAIACDKVSGNIFIGGQFTGQQVNWSTYSLNNRDLSGQTSDIFYANYNANGNLQWLKSNGSDDDDFCSSMDCKGHVFMAGNFKGTVLNLLSDTLTNAASGHSDMFLAEFTQTGTMVSALSKGGLYNDGINGVCVDNKGNVHIAGYYGAATLTFGADTITNYWADGGFYINRWNVFTAKAGVVSKEPVSTTAINSQNMDAAGYHLYPNPAKNILYIETPISVSAAVRLYVRDILGRICYDKTISGNTSQIDLENFSPGVYYLSFDTGAQKITQKFVKE